MQYAIIENGIIVNVVNAEEDFAAEMGWVSFPTYIDDKAVGAGWKFDGSTFSAPDPIVETNPTEPTKEELFAQLQAIQAQIQAL